MEGLWGSHVSLHGRHDGEANAGAVGLLHVVQGQGRATACGGRRSEQGIETRERENIISYYI